jgi:hypothetical protein
MHSHVSHSTSQAQGGSAAEAQGGGLLDSLSDTLLNAFSRVRKPDEKFEGMRERLERLEEGLGGTERVILRSRARHGGESIEAISPFMQMTHITDALQRLLPLALFLLRNLNLLANPLLHSFASLRRLNHLLAPLLLVLLMLSPRPSMLLNFLHLIWERNLKIWPQITKTLLIR